MGWRVVHCIVTFIIGVTLCLIVADKMVPWQQDPRMAEEPAQEQEQEVSAGECRLG
jgi:Sec-independent protein secretion pathway component TatC